MPEVSYMADGTEDEKELKVLASRVQSRALRTGNSILGVFNRTITKAYCQRRKEICFY